MSELRRGWTAVALRDVSSDISYGFTAPSSDHADGPKMLRITDIQDNGVDWVSVPRCECAQPAKYLLAVGDIVIARTGATTGKSFLLREVPEPSVFASYLIRVQPTSMVTPEYLANYMLSPSYWAQITVVSKGTAQPGANASILGGLEIPLPPLNEQRRLVAKLEALQTRSRRAREALDAVPPLLEKLRQSILAAAFRGDLTKDWRAKHKDVEPASKLLERIRAERRKKWEESELARMQAKGKSPRDEKWRAKYKEAEPVDAAGLAALPGGWCWASVDELCPGDAPAVYGIILPGEHVPGGVPYVRPVDMRDDGTVDLLTIKRTTEAIAAHYSRASLQTGDVVLSIVGTIGKVMVVPPELAGGNITQSSARIRPPASMSSTYLALALQSPTVTRQFEKYRFGNAVQRLNVEHVRRLAIPLPPESEQVAIAERAASTIRSMPTGAMDLLTRRLTLLERALLAKAFRGELVPQDPSDEPAEAMLSRLSADRDAAAPASAAKTKRGQKRRAG